MSRRSFLKGFLGLAGLPLAPGLRAQEPKRTRIQESPIAGFQYHQGERLWPLLGVGMPLELLRETDNRYDRKAVAVCWQGQQLGYVPRVENHAVSAMLDSGLPLQARISGLNHEANPSRRIYMEIYIES